MLVTRSEWCQSELSAAITHACRNSALQQPMSTRHPCSWKDVNKYIYIDIYSNESLWRWSWSRKSKRQDHVTSRDHATWGLNPDEKGAQYRHAVSKQELPNIWWGCWTHMNSENSPHRTIGNLNQLGGIWICHLIWCVPKLSNKRFI